MPETGAFESLLSAMFRHDEDGRLTGGAPQVHILRTVGQVFVRCHADLPDQTAERIEALAHGPRGKPGAWAEEYARSVSLIAKVADVTAVRAGPLYAFPERLAEPSDCVVVDARNRSLLRGALDEWIDDSGSGSVMVAALSGGRAVSVCASVRVSEGAHCAGVETAPGYRGRGFAQQAVVGWAQRVRAQGAEPFYATTFDNLASQRLARSLGLDLVGSEFSIYGGTVR